MTTTINRQLSLLVQGVMGKYGIDNLQLEIDLVSSLQRMWVEGGKDPQKLAVLREEILSSILGGARAENEQAQMEGRVKACMGISIDGRNRYEDMVRFLIKKDKDGQRVEQYAKWCKDSPFEAPKMFQISQRPDLLIETWDMAFNDYSVPEPIRPEHVRFTGGEDVSSAVPNPYKKPAILQRKTSSDLSGSDEAV